jgi:hypothetical protein
MPFAHGECPSCMYIQYSVSFLNELAACPYCKSVMHGHFCMSMLLVHSVFLHVHAPCPHRVSARHVHDTCPRGMSIPHDRAACLYSIIPHVRAACPCCVSTRHDHSACPRCMSTLHVRSAFQSCISEVHPCRFSVLHVRAMCTYCVSMLFFHAACSCY